MNKSSKHPDVSGHLDGLTKAMETAKKISEVKSFKRPDKDFMSTIFKHQFILTHYRNEEAKNENQYRFRTNYITSKLHSSLRKLEELKPILLKDMKVNKIHYGYYLECEVVGEPFYISGFFFF